MQVDGAEQNTIDEGVPFVIGNEAQPKVVAWQTTADADLIVAEQNGYRRLPQPISHRRTIRFDQRRRFWLVQDELAGEGTHEFSFRFHLAPGLETKARPDGSVEVYDKMNGARLLIVCQKPDGKDGPAGQFEMKAAFEPRFSSRDYGEKEPSVSVCWAVKTPTPFSAQFALIPVRSEENNADRLSSTIGNRQSTIDNN